MDKPPSVIAFYNSGVNLLANEPEIINIVKEMENKGVEVLICGTCTDYYKLGDRINTGKITDMLSIITRLAESGNVLKP